MTMTKQNTKGEIGVIVGRFQVHELHSGYLSLIQEVLSKHEKVIIFLGVTKSAPTKRNPLDYASRCAMIEEYFPDKVIVLPIEDMESDELWSKALDKSIRAVFPVGTPILYGSRDSFIKSYSGSFQTVEYEPTVEISGTDIRDEVSNRVLRDPMFRAGVIYSVSNRFPICYPCVDIAAFSRDGKQILMARKPNENKYRFIGGFVDPEDKSFEDAAMREFREETSGTIGHLSYEGSFKVNNWRYRNSEDGITTVLFSAKLLLGPVQPSDDICELKWFDIDGIERSKIVDEHQPLMDAIVSNFKLKYYNFAEGIRTDYAS